MDTHQICPECGARCQSGTTCENHFHQMLFWEAENPANGVVHHLMVLCYHLQHPTLYSADGLAAGKQLLTAFVKDGRSPADIRKPMRHAVDGGNRGWKITARPDSKGAYDPPVTWTMHGADVVCGGIDSYCDSVRDWAQSVYDSINAALPSDR